MEFFDWIILIVVGSIASAILQSIPNSNKKKGMEGKLNNLSDFSPSQKVMGFDGNSGIAIDEVREKVCLIKQSMENIELDALSYRDIISSEIFEDGVTITKTARGSQLGGALIGGLVLGGVGAIIGGLSGKTTTSDKVNKIGLRITVNRTKNPNHVINIIDMKVKKHGALYNSAMEQARHWHSLMEVLIKRADSEDVVAEKKGKLVETSLKLIPSRLVADELAKLGKLRKRGLLTNEEFLSQKAKLLS